MANSVWQATIQNAAGDIVPGAEITVIDEGTGLNAVIFSSKAGAALTNPFNADAGGFSQFYSGPGEYRITAFDIGTGLTQTFDNWRLGDAGAHDVGTATGQIPTADDLGVVGEVNFTTGNLNPNEFGSDGISDIVATGVATGSTGSLFFLPVTFLASSITVTSTFAVVTSSFQLRATGLIPIFDSASSTKLVSIAGVISGGVANEVLFLRSESASSKITVNS